MNLCPLQIASAIDGTTCMPNAFLGWGNPRGWFFFLYKTKFTKFHPTNLQLWQSSCTLSNSALEASRPQRAEGVSCPIFPIVVWTARLVPSFKPTKTTTTRINNGSLPNILLKISAFQLISSSVTGAKASPLTRISVPSVQFAVAL